MSVNHSDLVLVSPRDVLVRTARNLLVGEDTVLLGQLILRQRPGIRDAVLIFLERRRVRIRIIFSLDGR